MPISLTVTDLDAVRALSIAAVEYGTSGDHYYTTAMLILLSKAFGLLFYAGLLASRGAASGSGGSGAAHRQKLTPGAYVCTL